MSDHEPYEFCCIEHYPMPVPFAERPINTTYATSITINATDELLQLRTENEFLRDKWTELEKQLEEDHGWYASLLTDLRDEKACEKSVHALVSLYKENKQLRTLLQQLAQGTVEDIEAMGGTVYLCSYCHPGEQGEPNEGKHEPDCPILLARKALGIEVTQA